MMSFLCISLRGSLLGSRWCLYLRSDSIGWANVPNWLALWGLLSLFGLLGLWPQLSFAQTIPPIESPSVVVQAVDAGASAASQAAEAPPRATTQAVLPAPAASPVAKAASSQSVGGSLLDLRLPLPTSKPGEQETSSAIRVVVGLTVLAILPSLLVCMTAFMRIIIVLSMLRHAIGMPETPPNVALIGLALFLTLFTMNPVLQQIDQQGVQPYLDGKLSTQEALNKGVRPLREFMARHTREQDLAAIIEISHSPTPDSIDDVGLLQLVPAFMLSELRAAFQIGFMIFLPFLLIDLIVSSILMSLGMMMMPPTSVALPIKVLMFVLVDGWSLLVRALVGSFHG